MVKKIWLWLAIGTEVFHVLFIIGVLICGSLWLPPILVKIAITLTIMGQIIFLWCPLSVFSAYCINRYDPEKAMLIPSFSFFLYKKFGRKVGIPIFILLFCISSYVGVIVAWF